jgi:hypothetical protein
MTPFALVFLMETSIVNGVAGSENADPASPAAGRIQAGRGVAAARRHPRQFDNSH